MRHFLSLFLVFQIGMQGFAQSSMPLDSLLVDFEKVKEICDKDSGKLWGKSLYGPIIIIDPETKDFAANQAGTDSLFQAYKNIYVGKFPESKIVSCGVSDFDGTKWSMVSLGQNYSVQTIVHESFHRIQKSVGFDSCAFQNKHMDEMQARISLKLEWLALLNAIKANDGERQEAIKDALLFRQERRRLYESTINDENIFEIHEGLALYTELKLCSNSRAEFTDITIKHVNAKFGMDGSIVRSFGYTSGLMYAYLLDEADRKWRDGVSCEDDLGLSLQIALNIDMATDTISSFEDIKARYGYDTIYAKEFDRELKKNKKNEDERRMFVEKPILEFEFIEAGFNLNQSPHPLDSIGSVYPIIDISDKWGFLSVSEKGCLMMDGKARVTAEDIVIQKSFVTGSGWKLNLNEGWIIIENDKNYSIQKAQNAHL